MSTHNPCFRAKKNVYPCTPQFHYIKVGCKGVYRTCYHDKTSTACQCPLDLVHNIELGFNRICIIVFFPKTWTLGTC